VSRTTSFTFRDITQFVAASSAFSHQAAHWRRARPTRSPNTSTCRLGASANKNSLVVSQGYSSQQAVDWVKHNGNTFTR
jgi:hypothetical protein